MFGPLGAEKYREYCSDIHGSGAISARRHQRHSRHVEDRGRPHPPRLRGPRPRHAARRCHARGHRPAPRTSSSSSSPGYRPTCSLRADRRALKQIALNLLSNAVKFTPDGGRVTVRGRASDGCIVLGIADTGIGIAKDALAKLGRPFEQVESQLTKSHQGSGLGLAIAKSLVELHGGSHAHPLDARQRHAGGGAPAARTRNACCRRKKRRLQLRRSTPQDSRTKLARTLTCVSISRGIERSEIRHVGGARQQAATALPRRSWDRTGRQDRAAGSASGPDRGCTAGRSTSASSTGRTPQLPRLVEHARRRGVENVGQPVRVHQLQILGDEFDVDQPAGGVFEIPAVAVALFLGDRPAHLDDIAGDQRRIARPLQNLADHLFHARRTVATPKPPARASAPCAPRSRPRFSW